MKKRILFGFMFILGLFIISLIAAIDYIGETKAIVDVGEGIFCPSTYNRAKWENTFTGEFYPTVYDDPIYDCRDFWDYTSKNASCCPKSGLIFTECQDASGTGMDIILLPGVADPGDRWACLVSDIESCSSYDTQEKCEGYTQEVAEHSVESSSKYGEGWCGPSNRYTWYEDDDFVRVPTRALATKICSNFTSCACVWDESYGTDGGCLADARVDEECNDVVGIRGDSDFCQYFISIDDSQCNEPGGMITMSWELVNPLLEKCRLVDEKIPCTDVIKLSFFTWINVIVVIVILIIIYYLYSIKKGKKTKKGKKKTSKKKKR